MEFSLFPRNFLAEMDRLQRQAQQAYEMSPSIRGFARASSGTIGSLWVDVTRATLYVLVPLCIAPPDPELDTAEMPEDPEAAADVARRLDAAGIGRDNPLIVVHVSAGNPFRRWPASSFASAAATLASEDASRRIVIAVRWKTGKGSAGE